MTYFTDSPFERMMVPRPRHSPGPSPDKKPPGKCRGCGYNTGKPCVGVCLKKMMEKQEGKQNEP